jgi:maleate cis-trans isomerase
MKINSSILVSCVLFLLISCGQSDPKMCSCLEAGEKLNNYSSKMFTKEITEKDVKEMQKLREDKAKKCVDYQTMSGEEMLKRKADCE